MPDSSKFKPCRGRDADCPFHDLCPATGRARRGAGGSAGTCPAPGRLCRDHPGARQAERRSTGHHAYELKLTCEGYVVHQRLRLETTGPRGVVASEQQSQMTETRDGKKLRFEHINNSGRQSNVVKGEALLGDDRRG